jgi:hypothetical protein
MPVHLFAAGRVLAHVRHCGVLRAARSAGAGLGLSDYRAAAVSRLFGREPYGRAAAARSVAPLPQVGGTYRKEGVKRGTLET